jgi:hypothetical protein
MGTLLVPNLSSNEFMTCKDCVQRFATTDALRKRKNSGRGETGTNGKQHCHEIDWTSEAK